MYLVAEYYMELSCDPGVPTLFTHCSRHALHKEADTSYEMAEED